ncbi:rhodanese-like domain-containing protein [Winogradskyella alexanderae]|uniref:Rhodanese-like domain-containing protein n=1 Tax=Winogradskyella alexanderae TaxID=2877123 RepID=A0ABS7XTP0_9FLAO|nr:rhodanese-like domain-containing protein [Winogradskyella alexanderae]MCA0133155.1 rhodanese-like domain-containing protein [Winogradskyella alexanderae]
MKKLSLFLIGLLLVPALFTSCDRGEEPTDGDFVATPAFTLMKEYMVDNNLDINNIKGTKGQPTFFVKPAPAEADLATFLDTYYLMDIRSSADFAAARIDGANNVPFSDILTTAATTTKPILVVCYTGQTACYATALLRLYGYPDTYALKWGMSGWNAATSGKWDNNIGTIANGHPNWSDTDTAPTNLTFDDPTITTSLTNGQAILQQRVEAVVAAGFGPATVSGSDVLNSPGNYFINNYFSEGDYAAFGHIEGAYRILPFGLGDDSYKALNSGSNAQLVTYCYTGQTSAILTACLRVLGYDAYSMTFGMNGIYNDNPAWTSNQWGGDSGPKNLPIVP